MTHCLRVEQQMTSSCVCVHLTSQEPLYPCGSCACFKGVWMSATCHWKCHCVTKVTFVPLLGYPIWYQTKIELVSCLAHLASSPATQVTCHPPSNYHSNAPPRAWICEYPRSMRNGGGRQMPHVMIMMPRPLFIAYVPKPAWSQSLDLLGQMLGPPSHWRR